MKYVRKILFLWDRRASVGLSLQAIPLGNLFIHVLPLTAEVIVLCTLNRLILIPGTSIVHSIKI